MFELSHDSIVVPLGDSFWIADGALDEGLQASLQKLIDLVVIVIVVPDAEHALDVVPYGPSEPRSVHPAMRAHCVVGEIVGCLEFVVEEVADVVVEAIHERVAVIVPGVVLHAEGGDIVQLTTLEQMKETGL